MRKVIYRMTKEMIWKLYLEGFTSKERIIDYLNRTTGVKGKIVDIEVV